MASAPGAPPGSRVCTTSRLRPRSAAASAPASVDLPAPSPPSRVMSRPEPMALSRAEQREAQAFPGAGEPIGLADAPAGDERKILRVRTGRLDHQARHNVAFA